MSSRDGEVVFNGVGTNMGPTPRYAGFIDGAAASDRSGNLNLREAGACLYRRCLALLGNTNETASLGDSYHAMPLFIRVFLLYGRAGRRRDT